MVSIGRAVDGHPPCDIEREPSSSPPPYFSDIEINGRRWFGNDPRERRKTDHVYDGTCELDDGQRVRIRRMRESPLCRITGTGGEKKTVENDCLSLRIKWGTRARLWASPERSAERERRKARKMAAQTMEVIIRGDSRVSRVTET